MVAIYPGSFDPVTFGHFDIIKRAAAFTDTLIVAVMDCGAKSYLFTGGERVDLIKEIINDISGVKVIRCAGALVDLFSQLGADVIIRGARRLSDYERESMYAHAYKSINKKMETLLIPADPVCAHIASSLLKEAAVLGLDISGMTAPSVVKAVLRKLNIKSGGGN